MRYSIALFAFALAVAASGCDTCGNGRCDDDETLWSCYEDCPGTCGDGLCNIRTEYRGHCFEDCGPCDFDGECEADRDEDFFNCEDCGLFAFCGDNACTGDETRESCPQDCPI